MKMHEKKGQRNMRALLETCVILGALENRKPFDEDAQHYAFFINISPTMCIRVFILRYFKYTSETGHRFVYPDLMS